MRNKLKIMRKKQDLTQIELANKVNVSRKTIIDIENAKTNPSIIISLKLAAYLKIKVEELFKLE